MLQSMLQFSQKPLMQTYASNISRFSALKFTVGKRDFTVDRRGA